MAGGLTLTSVFEAMSLNYGEGVGIISELKKLTRGNDTYTYMSRQALRYELFRSLRENFGLEEGPLTVEQQVVQFAPEASIDYEELDFFGYMKTARGRGAATRPAVVRFSPAVSLEPYSNDLEFATNKNFADRAHADPNPYQLEQHAALYSYTLTIDLDRLGKDENDGKELSAQTRTERVHHILEALKVMSREIKGRIESLSPLFVIGGVYSVKNPFFLNRVKVFQDSSRRYHINLDLLRSTMELTFRGERVGDKTYLGYVRGFFGNEDQFTTLLPGERVMDLNHFFETLKERVKEFYEGAQS